MARVHPAQLAIHLHDSATHDQCCDVAEACCLTDYHQREDLAGEDFFILGLAPSEDSSHARRARAIARLGRHPLVADVQPVYCQGPTRWLGTNRLLLKPRKGGNAEIRRLLRAGAQVLREDYDTVLVRLHEDQDLDTEAPRLARLPAFEFAEPDYVLLRHLQGGKGGGAAMTQAPLVLIDAASGWKAGVASRSITIAILDCGVMPTHPDLKAAVGPTFDATSGKRDQSPSPWDSHGTSCAGLVAGLHTGTAGVKGVADGCTLMAVRIGRTPTRLASYVTKTSWLCRGIDWAWEHGADVLSMSFGGGPRSSAVTEALIRARTRGRKGKGAVLIASAGNGASGHTPVEFPATLSWVLAVAATDDQDRPKSAPTNQEPWVSASGAAVNIAAPGVACYTTTVPDPTEGETALYTTDFSGTSASTPLVAGAAALVIGANPAATEKDVRRILCQTADKVRTVRYTAGHSDKVGSGRLNVGAAVRAALASRRS